MHHGTTCTYWNCSYMLISNVHSTTTQHATHWSLINRHEFHMLSIVNVPGTNDIIAHNKHGNETHAQNVIVISLQCIRTTCAHCNTQIQHNSMPPTIFHMFTQYIWTTNTCTQSVWNTWQGDCTTCAQCNTWHSTQQCATNMIYTPAQHWFQMNSPMQHLQNTYCVVMWFGCPCTCMHTICGHT